MTDKRSFYDGDVVYSETSDAIRFGEVVLALENSISDGVAFGGVKLEPRVRWYPGGNEEAIEENNASLADRRLFSSNIVSRTSEAKGTQFGYVRGIKVTAYVKTLGSEYIISPIDGENLTPLREFEEGMPVYLGSWIGCVEKVITRITLQTSDGSKCEIKDAHHDRNLVSFIEEEKIFKAPRGFSPVTFYPGQKLRGPVCGLQQAAWLQMTRKLKRMVDTSGKDCNPCWGCRACRYCKYVNVTVEKIETESVIVQWLIQAHVKDGQGEEEWYDSTVTGDDLKSLKVLSPLDPFNRNTGRLGQRFYYNLSESDEIKKIRRPISQRESKELQEHSFGDYNWSTPQESSAEIRLGDIKSVEYKQKSKRFGSGKVKVEVKSVKVTKVSFKTSFAKLKLKRSHKKVSPSSSSVAVRPGMRLAVETICTKSRVTVVWQDGSVEYDVPSPDLHPVQSEDRGHFPGDFVLKAGEENTGVYGMVLCADRTNRTSKVQWFQPYTSGKDARPMPLECCETSLYDLKDHQDFIFPEEKVVVKLDNFEEETKCFAGQILEKSADGKICVRWVDGVTSMCWPQDLLMRVRELMHQMFFQTKKNNDIRFNLFIPNPSSAFFVGLGATNLSNGNLMAIREERSEDILDESSSKPVISETKEEGAGDFSIVETVPKDHKYKFRIFPPSNEKLFSKTVQKEIKLLRSSLPGGIWVRGFEDRLDLFSVMIRGPANTPYEDALFLFDLQLSPDYPKSPPMCHYVSFCEDRLNPNLYECGRVCVSLLGTWEGRDNEIWTDSSNLLQVVVSIQGLILVSEPYFNEAGYESKRGSADAREKSQAYNEVAVIKTMQSVIQMVRRPPSVFQKEILNHFKENAEKIMKRLESWVETSERTLQHSRSTLEQSATPNDLHELGDRLDGCFADSEDGSQQSISAVEENLPQYSGDGEIESLPEFPLIPASKGFCISIRNQVKIFRDVLVSEGISST